MHLKKRVRYDHYDSQHQIHSYKCSSWIKKHDHPLNELYEEENTKFHCGIIHTIFLQENVLKYNAIGEQFKLTHLRFLLLRFLSNGSQCLV